jgi:hypothetical protein
MALLEKQDTSTSGIVIYCWTEVPKTYTADKMAPSANGTGKTA